MVHRKENLFLPAILAPTPNQVNAEAYSGKFMRRLVQPQGEISVTLALEKFHLLGW